MKKVLFLTVTFCYLNIAAQLTDVITGLNAPVSIVKIDNYLYFSQHTTNKISKIDLNDTGNNPLVTDLVIWNLNGPQKYSLIIIQFIFVIILVIKFLRQLQLLLFFQHMKLLMYYNQTDLL